MKTSLSLRFLSHLFLCLYLMVSCNLNDERLIFEGKEYWGEYHAGDTTTLQQEYKIYVNSKDTLVYFTNFYSNGALKSKVTMKNDLLMEIDFVLDTLGNKLDFGKLKRGNGRVIGYSDHSGLKEYEGEYINGNREGWWINYHHHGFVLDSTLYINGYPQYEPSDDLIKEFLDLAFGTFKNNLYR